MREVIGLIAAVELHCIFFIWFSPPFFLVNRCDCYVSHLYHNWIGSIVFLDSFLTL